MSNKDRLLYSGRATKGSSELNKVDFVYFERVESLVESPLNSEQLLVG